MCKIKRLVNKGHKIFNATSVFEVTDIDRQSAIDFLNSSYGNPDAKDIDRYLDAAEKLGRLTRARR